jgi:hypothetical protein
LYLEGGEGRDRFVGHSHPKLAFGYDPVSDDYKVVRVVKFYKNQKISAFDSFEVNVYSLRAHSWRRAQGRMTSKELDYKYF